MTVAEQWKKLTKLLEEIKVYERCLGKVDFDMECCAPEDGIEPAGRDSAILAQHLYELTHAPEYTELLEALYAGRKELEPLQCSAVEHLYRSYSLEKNFTPEFNLEFNTALSAAYGTWLKAKKENNFALFEPCLDQIISLQRKAVATRDRKYTSAYDAMLDDYEEGTDIESLDRFFDAIKQRVIPLVRKIADERPAFRDDFMSRPCPIPKQEAFSRFLLDTEGHQWSNLVLMTTEHPFTTSFGKNDVRVTTHYYEDSFVSNIFTTLHEGGHALFMCGEPDEFYENYANDNMSNGMHECISRFFENYIGRSRAFAGYIYPKVCEAMDGAFSDVTEEEFYRAINAAKPSLIRTDADELTYSIHIVIRYEIEKMMVNDGLKAKDVPEIWNMKYKEYLGVDVPDDSRGCLQDVHWSGGFGYFPSYALGNAYGAQILRRMQKDFDVYAEVAKGNLKAVTEWLQRNVFNLASINTPDQWLKKITGEPLNVNYYLDYLEEKFSGLYDL